MKLQGKILKSDTDKRLVFGWASVVADAEGNLIVDSQGDTINIDTLENAAYEFVLRGGEGDLMHAVKGVAYLVESMVFTPEKAELLGLENVPQGWWVGFYVCDDKLWEQVKDGRFTMFSIGGRAVREELQ